MKIEVGAALTLDLGGIGPAQLEVTKIVNNAVSLKYSSGKIIELTLKDINLLSGINYEN